METRSEKNKREKKENKKSYYGPGCPLTDRNNKDVMHTIMKLLSAKDVTSLGGTCQKMKGLAQSENVWCHLLLRDYNVKSDALFDKNTSNKEIYKQEKEFDEKSKQGWFSWRKTRIWDFARELHRILYWTCRTGTIEVAKCCLRRGANIDEADEDGWTALMSASQNGHKEIVDLFLNKGADLDKVTNGGWTALMSASLHGHKEIVELLLDNGADIDKADNRGQTALMLASWNGYEDVAELLLNKGADINKANKRGHTALTIARSKGYEKIAELIKK